MLKSAVVKVKAVNISLTFILAMPAVPYCPPLLEGGTKKMPNTLFGGASINSACGYNYIL